MYCHTMAENAWFYAGLILIGVNLGLLLAIFLKWRKLW